MIDFRFDRREYCCVTGSYEQSPRFLAAYGRERYSAQRCDSESSISDLVPKVEVELQLKENLADAMIEMPSGGAQIPGSNLLPDDSSPRFLKILLGLLLKFKSELNYYPVNSEQEFQKPDLNLKGIPKQYFEFHNADCLFLFDQKKKRMNVEHIISWKRTG